MEFCFNILKSPTYTPIIKLVFGNFYVMVIWYLRGIIL